MGKTRLLGRDSARLPFGYPYLGWMTCKPPTGFGVLDLGSAARATHRLAVGAGGAGGVDVQVHRLGAVPVLQVQQLSHDELRDRRHQRHPCGQGRRGSEPARSGTGDRDSITPRG